MRQFWSYGPPDPDQHFCVPRTELVEQCVQQLVGAPGKPGRYFTIWAPRQTGKTWVMEQAKATIERLHREEFRIGQMSMQGVVMEESEPPEAFLTRVPWLFERTFGVDIGDAPTNWEGLQRLFSVAGGLLDRPTILLIDEFDSLPRAVIDRLVTMFRDLYLARDALRLHALALIGVRAVLGIESQRGSPFNIQRSLHIPNLSEGEVRDLFRQYQDESRQEVEAEVVREVYRATRGQPGLVGWFGELLTEKHNPGKGESIGLPEWRHTYMRACRIEWNNTVLNLIAKARSGPYQRPILELFGSSDIEFALDAEWCNYLYLNGIIDGEAAVKDSGEETMICRFSSPFIQERLYNALTYDLVGDRLPILAVEPLDDLEEVVAGETLNLPALLQRYKAYLSRLAARGIDPWKDQPTRQDLRPTEAVGHFHLYAWMQTALQGYGVVSPEFPTGNGKVDLHVRCDGKTGIVEIKSFANRRQLSHSVSQAARYAASLGLDRVTVALFVTTQDEAVLAKLSSRESVEDVCVEVVAIGWGG